MRVFGFNLLELIFVISISFAIVTSIHKPVIQDNSAERHRAEAKTALEQLATALEIYYKSHNTYENATLEALGIPEVIANYHYLLRIASVTDSNYFLQAYPLAEQANLDKECAVLTLDENGEKGTSGQKGVAGCW